MSEAVPVSLQCYMGRFELNVDTSMTIAEALRFFRRNVPALGEVNMNAYAVNHCGKMLLDEKLTLQEAQVKAESVLILVKKSSCPAANANGNGDDEE